MSQFVEQLTKFVLFIGNPRSGTTLVRSLLNAHPQVLIANEANVLRFVEEGISKEDILRRLIDNVKTFDANPVWTNYD